MIIKHFNQGWRGVKQSALETLVLTQYLRRFYQDQSKTVLVNNTWIFTEFGPSGEYRGESNKFRDSIIEWLTNTPAEYVFVYNFVDPLYTDELDAHFSNVQRLGYCHSPHWIDFQALAVDKFFRKDTVNSASISVPFMCLNGKPHAHRERLVGELVGKGLAHKGLVTFGGNDVTPKLSIPEDYVKLTGINADPYDAMTFGDMRNWNKHFLNVITETVWDVENFNMWTEKFFKPLLGERPFLFYTDHGAKNMLAAHGFESFIHEFTDISDLDLSNPHNITDFLVTLSSQPTAYLRHKYNQLLPKITYNKQRFHEHVGEQWTKVRNGIAI